MRALLIVMLAACRVAHPTSAQLSPPVAAKHAHEVKSANGTRNDEDYWLRDDKRSNRDVIGYLEAENRYAAAMLQPAQKLQDTLVAEIRGRIDESEDTVPVFDDG